MKFLSEVNIIVRGEGEETFVELLDALENSKNLGGVLGLTWRKSNGNIIRNKNCFPIERSVCFPDLESLSQKLSSISFNRIEAGRCCPYNCVFCSLPNMW